MEQCFVFPAVRGLQAGKPYYVIMCPLGLVTKLFTYTDSSLPADMRVQRTLNTQRIPEICNYILENQDSYAFSALTASVDGELEFKSIVENSALGKLHIPSNARVIINDGQHRRAAIEAALVKQPDLRHEDISVVIYYDLGLRRSQQIFSDLNRYAIRPTKSLNILYDNRDEFSILIKECIPKILVFNGNVETEKSTLSNRSKELFTLSGIFYASKLLLQKTEISNEHLADFIVYYWNAVAENMPVWDIARLRDISPEVFRQDYVCAHTITLKALGTIGNKLISSGVERENWSKQLEFLTEIDWRKDNPELQGIVMVNGKIASSHSNQRAFVRYILEKAGWDSREAIDRK